MKQFKRKLARLFGLALRSDLERVGNDWLKLHKQWVNDLAEANKYAGEVYRQRKLSKDAQDSFNEFIKEDKND